MEPVPIPDNALYIRVSMMLPLGNPAAVRDSDIATREMMLVALDISAFAATNDRLPETLDELAQSEEPGYALDPFSGERLRYEPGEDGAFRLWSVGRDLRDNGGVAPREESGRYSDETDLIWSTR